jgi:hypothetical protein
MSVIAQHTRKISMIGLNKAFTASSPSGSGTNVFATHILISLQPHPCQTSVAACSSHFPHSLSVEEKQQSLNLIILLGK